MSERYSRVFSLPCGVYAKDAPVAILAGAMLRDNENGYLLAQLKLQSVTDKTVKMVKVAVTCLDAVNRPVGEPIVHEYLDLNIFRGNDFGSKSPIAIRQTNTRSFTARVTEVGFSDNSVWSYNNEKELEISQQAKIASLFTDSDIVRGYKSRFGNSAEYQLTELSDIWRCTCGAINRSGEEVCFSCNAALEKLKAVDMQELKNDGIYENAVELSLSQKVEDITQAITLLESLGDYRDAVNRAEQCRERLSELNQKAKKKKKKIGKISAIAATVVVVLWLIGYFVAYPMISVAMGNYSVYINMYNVKEYAVKDGVTSIDSLAFDGCSSLTSVTIPDSVTSIGTSAFYDCESLTSVTIPDSVTSIGNAAFYGCSSLTSVVIGDSVTSIGDWAFRDCSSLTSVVIPDSVTSINFNAFDSCDNLSYFYYRGTEEQCPKSLKHNPWGITVIYNYQEE